MSRSRSVEVVGSSSQPSSELVLRSELHRILGVSRQRAGELAHRPDFPEPYIRTIGGAPLWSCRQVSAWNKRRPGPGRPQTADD